MSPQLPFTLPRDYATKTDIRNLQGQMDQMRDALNAIQGSQLVDIRNDLAALRTRATNLEAAATGAKSDISGLRSNDTGFAQSLADLQTSLKNTTRKADQNEAAIKSLQEYANGLAGTINTVQATAQNADAKVEGLKTRVASDEKAFANLQGDVQKNTDGAFALLARSDQAIAELKSLKSADEDIRGQLTTVKSDVTTAKSNIAAEKARIDALSSTSTSHTSSISTLQTFKTDATTKLTNLEAERVRVSDWITFLDNERKVLLDKIANLKTAINGKLTALREFNNTMYYQFGGIAERLQNIVNWMRTTRDDYQTGGPDGQKPGMAGTVPIVSDMTQLLGDNFGDMKAQVDTIRSGLSTANQNLQGLT